MKAAEATTIGLIDQLLTKRPERETDGKAT